MGRGGGGGLKDRMMGVDDEDDDRCMIADDATAITDDDIVEWTASTNGPFMLHIYFKCGPSFPFGVGVTGVSSLNSGFLTSISPVCNKKTTQYYQNYTKTSEQ